MGLIRPKMTRLFSQNVASQINYARIIVRRSWVTRELDGMRGAGQSYTDSLGERHWIRCDETNCRSHRRGMITSTIHVLVLVPVFFVLMKERSLRRGTLRSGSAELK
jgi:hypothetical protein